MNEEYLECNNVRKVVFTSLTNGLELKFSEEFKELEIEYSFDFGQSDREKESITIPFDKLKEAMKWINRNDNTEES